MTMKKMEFIGCVLFGRNPFLSLFARVTVAPKSRIESYWMWLLFSHMEIKSAVEMKGEGPFNPLSLTAS